MPQLSERWEIQIGKNKHILSGQEKELVLKAKEMGLNFVKFKDLVVNPAFVQDMVLVERVNTQQIAAPDLYREPTKEEIKINIEKIKNQIIKAHNNKALNRELQGKMVNYLTDRLQEWESKIGGSI